MQPSNTLWLLRSTARVSRSIGGKTLLSIRVIRLLYIYRLYSSFPRAVFFLSLFPVGGITQSYVLWNKVYVVHVTVYCINLYVPASTEMEIVWAPPGVLVDFLSLYPHPTSAIFVQNFDLLNTFFSWLWVWWVWRCWRRFVLKRNWTRFRPTILQPEWKDWTSTRPSIGRSTYFPGLTR